MLILPESILEYQGQIGPKTINLKRLMDFGVKVPRFLAIPVKELALFPPEDETAALKVLSNWAKEITIKLNCQAYAIRSSALTEDTMRSSRAGQFLTKTNVTAAELPKALQAVLKDASLKLAGDLSIFSILVQEYMKPEFSGVTFTRNPLKGREMVLEYHTGAGEAVVGGQVRPQNVKFFWRTLPPTSLPKALKEQILSFQELENYFGFPQDIEWCVSGGQLFFLQTRPITSLTESDYEEFRYLDSVLPVKDLFFYQKTEISEIAPRPTPFTLNLLKKIYAQNGPVCRVYEKYSISYHDTDFLRLVGNELYVDKEAEIKSLLPAYAYKGAIAPVWSRWSGSLITLKNLVHLNLLPLRSKPFWEKLRQKLGGSHAQTENISEAVSSFLQDYELVFEINLLAAKALKNLERVALAEHLSVAVLLSWPEGQSVAALKAPENLAGNSLEIMDVSEFQSRLNISGTAQKTLPGLSTWKLEYLKNIVNQALAFSRLREYSRWLTVRNISHIRQLLWRMAEEKNFKNRDSIFFFNIKELAGQKFTEEEGEKRFLLYRPMNAYNFSASLTGWIPKNRKNDLLGVSSGRAVGHLISTSQAAEGMQGVLYTKILSPDLVKYFSNLSGIVSEQGGVLSHLAIMAREYTLPVVVNFKIENSHFKIGDKISLDADRGTISKVK